MVSALVVASIVVEAVVIWLLLVRVAQLERSQDEMIARVSHLAHMTPPQPPQRTCDDATIIDPAPRCGARIPG